MFGPVVIAVYDIDGSGFALFLGYFCQGDRLDKMNREKRVSNK